MGATDHIDRSPWRLGLDLGRSRLRGVVLDTDHRVVAQRQVATPEHDYRSLIGLIAELVKSLETEVGQAELPLGLAVPSGVSAASQRLRRGPMPLLNDRPLPADVSAATAREVRTGHAAGCRALAEAADGSLAGFERVFVASIGSSVSGALLLDGRLAGGPNGTAGAWGHTSLPWPNNIESRAFPECWCGQAGCIEAWVSGLGMSADHVRRGGHALTAEEIVERAEAGERLAGITLRDWLSRMARGLATLVNIVEPERIVVGGGLSRIRWLYSEVPKIWGQYCLSDRVGTEIVPATHGETAAAFGAALLWP
ncbi:ROK family protein [Salinisphaera sp. SPP-AMP-43]|uniref:ROK family protein n=1 Tax=Salinisphaera sp. SPP-AMP-43 TaxID=3121288 RepID=UPI003C6DC565